MTPTETSAIVLTETTRMPASSTGPASGQLDPQEAARRGSSRSRSTASMVVSSTEASASAAERAMIATP